MVRCLWVCALSMVCVGMDAVAVYIGDIEHGKMGIGMDACRSV